MKKVDFKSLLLFLSFKLFLILLLHFYFFFPLNFTQNSREMAKLIQHDVRIDQANLIPMLSKPVTKVFVQVKN